MSRVMASSSETAIGGTTVDCLGAGIRFLAAIDHLAQCVKAVPADCFLLRFAQMPNRHRIEIGHHSDASAQLNMCAEPYAVFSDRVEYPALGRDNVVNLPPHEHRSEFGDPNRATA